MDAMERTLISVTWRLVSSGIDEIHMICVMCKTDVLRRCRHERACEKKIEVQEENGNSGDGMEGNRNDELSGSEYRNDLDDGKGSKLVNEQDEAVIAEPRILEPDAIESTEEAEVNN